MSSLQQVIPQVLVNLYLKVHPQEKANGLENILTGINILESDMYVTTASNKKGNNLHEPRNKLVFSCYRCGQTDDLNNYSAFEK